MTATKTIAQPVGRTIQRIVYGTVLARRSNLCPGCFMATACSGYPQRVRHELTELIQKQINSIEKETYGGASDRDRWEYEERRKRIDELHCELQRLESAV
jgi:hypothetical protein